MIRRLLVCLMVATLGLPVFAIAAPPPAEPATPDSQPLNIEISPATLILKGTPGTPLKSFLKIRNRNMGTEQLKIELMQVRGTGDKLEITQPAVDDPFPTWVDYGTKGAFAAQYDKWVTVNVTINLPREAAFGYYYALVISKTAAPVVQPGSTQALEGKVAQFILLDVDAPGAQRSVAITRFTTDHPWYEFLPVNFDTTITNTGNVHVAPRGNIFIRDMAGRQIHTIEVNTEGGNILPNMYRSFASQWNKGFPHYEDKDGERKLIWNLAELSTFRIGKYAAELVIVYNDGLRDIPVSKTAEFWVIPWRIILAILVILLVLIAGTFFTVRAIWRAVKEHGHHTQEVTVAEEETVSPPIVEEPPVVAPPSKKKTVTKRRKKKVSSSDKGRPSSPDSSR